MSRKVSIALTASVLVLSACSVLTLRAADRAKSPTDAAQPAAAAAAAGEGKGRYFEMRIYTVNEGKLAALHQRFRDHTIRLFKRHGIETVGYWTRADQPNTLVFIISYPSKDARDKHWNAFTSDPEWKKAAAESEKDGKLVAKAEQVFMSPTDYSPAK